MYDELVKRLRCQRFGNCPNCPMWYTEEVEPNLWRERCAAIDAADAIEELIAWHNADVRELGRQKILIAGMRPVVRGRWQSWTQDRPPCKWYSCDYCGFHALSKSNSCPNCGADMRPASMSGANGEES